MTFTEMQGRTWTAIGRNVFADGPDGAPVLVAVVDETGTDTNPGSVNAIAAHVTALHNSNLTKRIINASGAAMAAARRS